MKNIQQHFLAIKKRAWKHKKPLYHMNKAIFEMEQVYLHTSHHYDAIIFSIHEMKMYRIQEYFEYKNVLSILKKSRNLKRAWKHKKTLYHMDKAIFEMEQVYLHTSHHYDAIIFSIHEIKMYRIQEYFEYKNALSILKKSRILTA